MLAKLEWWKELPHISQDRGSRWGMWTKLATSLLLVRLSALWNKQYSKWKIQSKYCIFNQLKKEIFTKITCTSSCFFFFTPLDCAQKYDLLYLQNWSTQCVSHIIHYVLWNQGVFFFLTCIHVCVSGRLQGFHCRHLDISLWLWQQRLAQYGESCTDDKWYWFVYNLIYDIKKYLSSNFVFFIFLITAKFP